MPSSNPLGELSCEHRYVLDRLRALEASAASLDLGSVREILSEIQAYSAPHFRKEEEGLFPVLGRYFEKAATSMGGPVRPPGGPVQVMMAEHKSIRMIVELLEKALNRGEAAEVRGKAQHLIDLLRSHIYREDHVLFKAASANLTSEEVEEVAARFQRLKKP
ncbi:hemerythrin domain-containing protein [Candidatus Hecatella orcuttiae]|uniref:hemerythrin domain-containing protein n=1 Tax=Candidatus Hecatella orcuttiae TaxID=1935119 RepID=UPI002867F129|nr:hemerythrin domain-containing protein [Candidatus Hecatella orcuttiae]